LVPKGNRSDRRGHRPKVGGEKSIGTITKRMRLPVETWNRIERKLKNEGGNFSGLIRLLLSNWLGQKK